MRWAFAGRAGVVSTALRALSAGRSLVITGDAGVGKTRLALDLVERLAVPRHAVVRFGAAPALEEVPLGALARFTMAVESDAPEAGVSDAPSHAGNDRDVPEVTAQRLRAVYRALLEAVDDEPEPVGPAGRRLVLLIDDVQWLDPLSATAVAQLVVSGDAVLLATRRSGLMVPDAIRRLRVDDGCDTLTLESFTLEEVEDVLTANLGPVERQTVDELYAATGGNALLLEDLVRAAQASGALVQFGTGWMWDRTIPDQARLNDLVEERLARLTLDQIDALTIVAAGEPLPLPVANEAIDRTVLATLEREGIVVVRAMGDADVRLAHPLYGEIVRARLGPLERAAVHARLVDAASTAQPEPDPARVAIWCLDAGEKVDPAQLVVASERAIAGGDGRLALRLAERALAAGDRPDALLALGRSMVVRGRRADAIEVLTQLVDLPIVDDAQRVEAGLWLVIAHHTDIERAEPVVRSVLGRLTDPASGDLLRAQWAFSLTMGDRWREARPISEALASSEQDEVAIRAVQPLVISMVIAGESSRAADLAAAALPRAIGLADTVPEAIRWVFGCCVTAGLIDGRLTEVQNLLDLAGAAGAPAGAEGYFSMIRGKLAMLQGRALTARTELEAANERLRRTDGGEWLGWASALLVEATAIGSPEAVPATSLTAAPEESTVDQLFFDIDAQRARAWAALARGDRKHCLVELTAVADRAAEVGHLPFEALALHDALRLGARPTKRLEAVADRFESRWGDPVQAHCRGRRTRDPEPVAAAAQQFEDIGAMLLAAECWATAARLAAQLGLRDRVRQHAARSVRIAERCEGAVTPALELPSAAPDLTARERRVAQEAAAGRRSRDIAEELDISIRTVDNLLGRVYTKLGVSGRDELADVLGVAPS